MIRVIAFIILYILSIITSSAQITSEEVLIKNDSIVLPGTLTYTKNSTDLIIWVHGSGNVDRNGNQAGMNIGANYIKQLRDSINKRGIAFFSYDKRTATPQNMKFLLQKIVFEDLASDVEKVVSHFKTNKRYKSITLVGHSQGSLVAMLASANVDKYISLAGPSERIDRTLIRQISRQSAALGKTTAAYFKELKETGEIKEVHPMLMSIFAKQNIPFIASWMQYDPVEEIKNVEVPTLIVTGTKDLQIPVSNAKALHNAKKDSELVIIEQMNHVLKHIEHDADNMRSYQSPGFPVSKRLIEVISTFIKK